MQVLPNAWLACVLCGVLIIEKKVKLPFSCTTVPPGSFVATLDQPLTIGLGLQGLSTAMTAQSLQLHTAATPKHSASGASTGVRLISEVGQDRMKGEASPRDREGAEGSNMDGSACVGQGQGTEQQRQQDQQQQQQQQQPSLIQDLSPTTQQGASSDGEFLLCMCFGAHAGVSVSTHTCLQLH